jgi:uncharacterized phage-associated protein
VRFRFDPKKSAQAASILLRLNGGDMGKYLFIKMLYLADREAIQRLGLPITGDAAVSMEHGPVLSTIYDLTKADRPNPFPDWERFISAADEETHHIFLKDDPGTDELSLLEISILKEVYAQFRKYSWKQIKDYCHGLREYDGTVGRSSQPIPAEEIFKAVGKTSDQIDDTEKILEESRVLAGLLRG